MIVSTGYMAIESFLINNRTKNVNNIHMIIMDYELVEMTGDETTRIVIISLID